MTLSNSLGATRAEKLEKLFSNLPNNAFPTAVEMGSDYQPGVFSWDEKHIHFDYLGAGKPQRLTVRRSDIEVADASEASDSFAPSEKDSDVGERTEFVGTAHAVHNTPLWKKRAWNTLNEWCSMHSWRLPTLVFVIRFSEDAYARLTRMEGVYYFMSSPEQTPHHPTESDDLRVFAARVLRHIAMFNEAHWLATKDLTEETRGYLDVAWDTYEESGGKRKAPFR